MRLRVLTRLRIWGKVHGYRTVRHSDCFDLKMGAHSLVDEYNDGHVAHDPISQYLSR
jgi:hypothetical protein